MDELKKELAKAFCRLLDGRAGKPAGFHFEQMLRVLGR